MSALICNLGRVCRTAVARCVHADTNSKVYRLAGVRAFSDGSPEELTEGEKNISTILKAKFPSSKNVQVRDISGGCGSMYEVYIESNDFKGKRIVAQHQMVTKALAEEIKDMHGVRINTAVPENS